MGMRIFLFLSVFPVVMCRIPRTESAKFGVLNLQFSEGVLNLQFSKGLQPNCKFGTPLQRYIAMFPLRPRLLFIF